MIEYKQTFMVYREPNSPAAEAIRSLYTNIRFLNVDKKCQVITITSSIPGEGKTAISSNLAAITAGYGKKTLLVDCDMRKGRLSEGLHVKIDNGLSDILLKDELQLTDINFYKTTINNLFALLNKNYPPNPAELLDRPSMDRVIEIARQEFDVIYIDTPPVLSVADALIVAKKSDGIILVATLNQTPRPSLERAYDVIKEAKIRLFGTVLNKDTVSTHNKYGYYYKTSKSYK